MSAFPCLGVFLDASHLLSEDMEKVWIIEWALEMNSYQTAHTFPSV